MANHGQGLVLRCYQQIPEESITNLITVMSFVNNGFVILILSAVLSKSKEYNFSEI